MSDWPGLPTFDDLWDYDHPDQTEARFCDLLPDAQGSGNTGYLAELLTQIARAQGLQRKFDEAHETLNEAESLISDDLVRAQIRLLLERGRVYNSSGAPDRARPLFTRAWELARQAGEDFYAVDAAHMLGIVEKGETSTGWNRRALEVAEASAQPRARRWLGSLYNNLGWTYHDMGEYEQALELFGKALEARREEGKPGPIRIARWCVARATRSLGRVEEALAMQRALLAEEEQAGEEPGFTLEEIGECLLALGEAEEARPYFARAYAALSKDPWLAEGEPERLERLRRLGEDEES